MTLRTIIHLKIFLSIVGFVLAGYSAVQQDPFSEWPLAAFAGWLTILSPAILWNRWLYEGMFEEEKTRKIISYRMFQLVGMLMALALAFSMLLHV